METTVDSISVVQIDLERIDALAHLWKALHHYHAKVTPQLGETRSPEESWSRRKADYKTWFTEPDTFVLLAEFEKRPVGYVFVRIQESNSTTWESEDRIAKVETLSILPDFRGMGIGAKLMDQVYVHLKSKSISNVSLTVVATNPKAIEFYLREGFDQWFLTMGKRISS